MSETQAAAAEPTQEAPLSPSATLPQYQCFKTVQAAKVVAAVPIVPSLTLTGIELQFESGVGQASVFVEPEWLLRRTDTLPTGDFRTDIETAIAKAVGGYYVVYEDGYASWSPAPQFEVGYAPLMTSTVGENNVASGAAPFEMHELVPIDNGHMAEDFHGRLQLYRVEREGFERGAVYALDNSWTLHELHLQAGPAAEVGVNGFTIENLLAIARNRLELWQQGEFKCHANKMAIHYIRGALDALNIRTADRLARGVEGTGVV